MRRILIVFALLLLVGCTTLSPPELTATAAHQTPTVWITNTAIPTDWPTAESTEFPYYRRDCVPDAININACGVQKPYTTQPYNMVVEFWPFTGDDWPDELMPGVHWDDGELVYDVMGDEGGFTGDIVLGEREFFWTFYTNSTNRAIEEFQLGYHQNSMIVKAGNDITFQWINFHGGEGSAVPQSACGNQAPSW